MYVQYQLNERLLAASTTWRPLVRPDRKQSRRTLGQAGPGSVKSMAPAPAAFMHPAALQATSLATGIDLGPYPRHAASHQLESQPDNADHQCSCRAPDWRTKHRCEDQASHLPNRNDHGHRAELHRLACSANGHVSPSVHSSSLDQRIHVRDGPL